MVHREDAHIGAPAGAALLHRLRCRVKNGHEGDGARGDALGGLYHVVLRPDAGEGKARAAARLVDKSGMLHGLEDLVHGVAHGQHKAGGQLAQFPARVHERGAVGEEFKGRHHAVELAGALLDLLVRRPVGLVSLSDRPGNAGKHVISGLDHLPVFVPFQIAFFEDLQAILRQTQSPAGDGSQFRTLHSSSSCLMH